MESVADGPPANVLIFMLKKTRHLREDEAEGETGRQMVREIGGGGEIKLLVLRD